MLEQLFYRLCSAYSPKKDKVYKAWIEIYQHYTSPSRYYHNLDHLEQVHSVLQHVQTQLKNIRAVWFALFYHDIIYGAGSGNNEERSSDLAVARERQFYVDEPTIELSRQMIMATKQHASSDQEEINYFTDADLSILGQEPWVYLHYSSSIRKEYQALPEPVFRQGRMNVLQKFLSMKRIFKTGFFYERYENRARQNLKDELMILKKSG